MVAAVAAAGRNPEQKWPIQVLPRRVDNAWSRVPATAALYLFHSGRQKRAAREVHHMRTSIDS